MPTIGSLLVPALLALPLTLPGALAAQEAPEAPTAAEIEQPKAEPEAPASPEEPAGPGEGTEVIPVSDAASGGLPSAITPPPTRSLTPIDLIKDKMDAACRESAKFCGISVAEFCSMRTDACSGVEPCALKPETCDHTGGGGGGGGDALCSRHPEKCGSEIADICRTHPEKCASGGDFCKRHPRRCATGTGLPPQPVLGVAFGTAGSACGFAQPDGSAITGRMRISLADGTPIGRARSVCVRPGIGVDLVDLVRPLAAADACLALRTGSYRIN